MRLHEQSDAISRADYYGRCTTNDRLKPDNDQTTSKSSDFLKGVIAIGRIEMITLDQSNWDPRVGFDRDPDSIISKPSQKRY